MVQGRDHNVMPDQRTISYEDASLILEFATAVYEAIPTKMDVLPAVGIEGRKERKSIRHWSSCQFPHKNSELFGGMVSTIHLSTDTNGLLRYFMHDQMSIRSAHNTLASIEHGKEFFSFHDSS